MTSITRCGLYVVQSVNGRQSSICSQSVQCCTYSGIMSYRTISYRAGTISHLNCYHIGLTLVSSRTNLVPHHLALDRYNNSTCVYHLTLNLRQFYERQQCWCVAAHRPSCPSYKLCLASQSRVQERDQVIGSHDQTIYINGNGKRTLYYK